MATRYLLDTNTASYLIKGNVPTVRERLASIPMSQVCISAVTEGELRFGVIRKPKALQLGIAVAEFLLRVDSMPWNSEAALSYAQLRATLERDGTPMGNLDMMIAAHALALQAVLVTHDAVFRHVKLLKTEDWTH